MISLSTFASEISFCNFSVSAAAKSYADLVVFSSWYKLRSNAQPLLVTFEPKMYVFESYSVVPYLHVVGSITVEPSPIVSVAFCGWETFPELSLATIWISYVPSAR